MKVQEEPVRTLLMFLDNYTSEISAFEDAGKIAPKMVHLPVIETLAKKGKIF